MLKRNSFESLFKADYSNELIIYSEVCDLIANINKLLDNWISKNKFSQNSKIKVELLDVLSIETNINYLLRKGEISNMKDLPLNYEKLEKYTSKLKNKILEVCSDSDLDLVPIYAELIKLRTLITYNLGLPALSSTANIIGSNTLLYSDKNIFYALLELENQISIRRRHIINYTR